MLPGRFFSLLLWLKGNAIPMADMFDVNTDYNERTFLELETQNEPSIEIQNKIAQAIADFEADS